MFTFSTYFLMMFSSGCRVLYATTINNSTAAVLSIKFIVYFFRTTTATACCQQRIFASLSLSFLQVILINRTW